MVGSDLDRGNMTEQTSSGFTNAGHFGHDGPSTSTTASSSCTTTITTTTTTTPIANNRDDDSAPPPSLHSHRQNHSSSKLPAFRFADLKPGSATSLAHPVLTQPGPPTPVSPASAAPDPSPSPSPSRPQSEPLAAQETTHNTPQQDLRASVADDSPPLHDSHSRPQARQQFAPATTTASPPATTTTTSSPPSSTPPADYLDQARGPTSNPQSPADSAAQVLSPSTDVAVRPQARRPPALRSFSLSSTPAGPSPASKNTHRRSAADLALGLAVLSPDKSSLDSPSGQRELILPKTLSQSNSPEERRASLHRSPPVSYRPPINATAAQSTAAPPVRVPPIRAFRSSGSRKSLGLDMNLNFNTRPYDSIDDVSDLNHDRTLRALEGRFEPESTQLSPPALTGPNSARHENPDGDDTGDVFLKIAREEDVAAPQASDGSATGEPLNAVVSAPLSLHLITPHDQHVSHATCPLTRYRPSCLYI